MAYPDAENLNGKLVAAIAGGLAENQLYRTSTGVLMVVYTP